MPPPQAKAPPPPLPEAELQGLPLAVANLRCVLETAHAGGWVAWRDLAAQLTVDDRMALAEALVGYDACAAGPDADRRGTEGEDEAPVPGHSCHRRGGAADGQPDDYHDAQDLLEDTDGGFFFYHFGGAAVGMDGRSTVAAAGSMSGSVFLDAPPPDRTPRTGAVFLQTAASTPASTTPGDGTPWGLTPEMVRQGIARAGRQSPPLFQRRRRRG